MFDVLLKEKTTVLTCIIAILCLALLASLKVIEGQFAVDKILWAVGLAAGRQVLAGIQRPQGS